MVYIKLSREGDDKNLYTLTYLLSQGKNQVKIRLKKFKSIFHKNINKSYKDVPVKIWIEPTNICNLKCIMCPNGTNIMKRKKGFMDYRLYKKIIDEASKWNASINLYHMGESLIHPKIFDMIKYAKTKNCRHIQLVSNGALLDQDKALRILDSGLDIIQFSFDGATKETYEKIRRNADFDKVLKNIKRFLELKKKKKKNLPHVRVQIIDMEKNRKELYSFVKLFKEIGVDIISTKGLRNWAGSINLEETSKGEYAGCLHPWNYSTITWEGDVIPCCRDYDAMYKMGNINEDSLRGIWNNKKMKFLRNSLMTEKAKKIKLCEECDELYRKHAKFIR